MKRVLYGLLAVAFAAIPAARVSGAPLPALASGPKTISGDTPPAVSRGLASLHGHHNGEDLLRINVGLAVHNSAQLDALIASARIPGSPNFRHYVSTAQYMAQYAPTDAEAQAAKNWLQSQRLTVTGISADHLLVHVQAKAKDAERAFGVTINDYTYHGRSFHANDRDPTVPADLSVNWISGLDDFTVYQPDVTCVNPGPPASGCGYDGSDFRGGYNVSGDGKGQTIGFTLWGKELPQSDFTGYATGTSTTALTIGQAGNDGIDYVQVDGASTIVQTTVQGEIALDTENAHALAPGIHETYWLGVDNTNATLEDVLNDAASSSLTIISNSWGAQANPCSVDSNMETSLQKGAAAGKTFLFATGDGPASSGCSYPAVSQYVLAVGGDQLTVSGGAWSSEIGVHDGGGCLGSETRPSWQTGIGTAYSWTTTAGNPNPTCSGRAEPDVSADSGFCSDGSSPCGTGTYIYFNGSGQCCWGGTSLATPLWAAMQAVWINNNAATVRPAPGFLPPLIYALANDPTTYANDFHDITSGGNGFNAVSGWDEATGWGSPNFNNLANNLADITYSGPTSANKGDTITLSATLLDHGAATPIATTALGAPTVTFAAAGETCTATADATGYASCTVTINDNPGHYKVIAVFAGDQAYKAVSQTLDFTVLHIPTSVTYTGDTSDDYNDPATLSAKLIESSDSAGISGETLNFSLGAESCSAKTGADGTATCQVTPLDNPGSYTVTVGFAGDEPTYEPSSTSASFTLRQEESQLTNTGPVTVHYRDPLTVSSRLTDPDGGAGIGGKTVTFTLGGADTCSSVTDGTGAVSCSITPHVTGSQTLTESFGPDTDYLSSTISSPFAVTPEETTMRYTGPTVILAGAAGATLSAQMVEDGSADADGDGGSPAPIPAQSVTLSVGSQNCTGTTDSSGNVKCTIPSISVPLGPETVSASFAGNSYYSASSDSKSAIVFAFPAGGVFTLGDKTAANAGSSTVTWWGDTWWQLNSLSGSTAPSAFKGFANMITLPTTSPPAMCGSNWSTGGGNSPPPASGVPSYMGVVVTSKITKSGTVVSGNSVHIVVVRVNPGYSPNPMNHGTGTIVTSFC